MGRNVTTWEETNTLKRYARSSAERAKKCRELREGQTLRSPVVETRRACLARKKHLLCDFVEREDLDATGGQRGLDPATAVPNTYTAHISISPISIRHGRLAQIRGLKVIKVIECSRDKDGPVNLATAAIGASAGHRALPHYHHNAIPRSGRAVVQVTPH